MPRRARAPLYILEGTWWSHREVPQVLPYFEALARTSEGISLSHRTFRSSDDLHYWIGQLPKGERAFVYIACHGEALTLCPTEHHRIPREELMKALGTAREDAVEFLHFGCCEMIDANHRRDSLDELAKQCGARWVSGYTKTVPWFQSTLLDLAVVEELFVPFFHAAKKLNPRLRRRAQNFLQGYDQLARTLGFSGLMQNLMGETHLLPQRLHQ